MIDWRRRMTAFRLLFSPAVVLPVLMAGMVFYVFTDIVFFGGRRESLAAKVEKHLIERSLQLTEAPARTPGAVLTVSLSDADLGRLKTAPSTLVKDADLAVYAEVVAKVAAMRPSLLVVSWLSNAHSTDLSYWEPMVETMRHVPDPERVLFGYPINEIPSIPAEVRKTFQIREGEDCVYDVNSYCSVNPKWHQWLIQSLIEILWKDPPPYHISDNLPHVLPNFILNFPSRDSIPNVSFSDVLDGKVPAAAVRDKIVMIGNDTSQSPIIQNNKTIVRRTYTATSHPGNLIVDGTPLHVFWAQMAQMFVDRSTIAVAPFAAETYALVVMGAAILLTMYFFGQAASVALLLLSVLAAPFLNALSIKYLQLYLPLFLLGYGSLLIYVLAAFGLMSLHNFQRQKLEAARSSLSSTADLKTNFISLISHNLNTPVAKLLGLVDVLLMTPRPKPVEASLRQCRKLVTHMQFLVKSTLLSTSLESKQAGGGAGPGGQGQLSGEARISVKNMLREFEQSERPLLTRLGIELTFAVEDEQLFTDLAMDPRLGAHALVAMALLAAANRSGRYVCRIELSSTREHVIFSIVPHPTAAAATAESGDESPSEGFLHRVLGQYVASVVRTYGGIADLRAAGASAEAVKLAALSGVPRPMTPAVSADDPFGPAAGPSTGPLVIRLRVLP